MSDSKITIFDKKMKNHITAPLNSQFGTLRLQFEENGKIKEIPILPSLLHDIFIKDLYQRKDLINS